MKELIIIGAGPAGLGASIYASRYKLDHLVIGSEIGGQVTEASRIENWAGEKSISGRELMDKFIAQAKELGAEIIQDEVERTEKIDDGFKVFTQGGKEYTAKALILALGMRPRKMNIPGEEKYVGKGVSYCATCDAMFFRNRKVAVVGGGDAAATAAIHLAEFVERVYLLYRDSFNWNPSWEYQLNQNSKIEKVCCSEVKEIVGDNKVSGIIYEEKGERKKLSVEGIFIEIGSIPGVTIAKDLGVEVDDQDYIKVDQTQATNVENVYAAGDVTTGSNKFRQIITAVAEGAVAAGSVYKKLKMNS